MKRKLRVHDMLEEKDGDLRVSDEEWQILSRVSLVQRLVCSTSSFQRLTLLQNQTTAGVKMYKPLSFFLA